MPKNLYILVPVTAKNPKHKDKGVANAPPGPSKAHWCLKHDGTEAILQMDVDASNEATIKGDGACTVLTVEQARAKVAEWEKTDPRYA